MLPLNILLRNKSPATPQIEFYWSDYWFITKIVKQCYFYTHTGLYSSVLNHSFVFQMWQDQLWVPSNLFLLILYQSFWMMDSGKKNSFFVMPIMSHNYILRIQMLCYGGEKGVVRLTGSQQAFPSNLENANQVPWSGVGEDY